MNQTSTSSFKSSPQKNKNDADSVSNKSRTSVRRRREGRRFADTIDNTLSKMHDTV